MSSQKWKDKCVSVCNCVNFGSGLGGKIGYPTIVVKGEKKHRKGGSSTLCVRLKDTNHITQAELKDS